MEEHGKKIEWLDAIGYLISELGNLFKEFGVLYVLLSILLLMAIFAPKKLGEFWAVFKGGWVGFIDMIKASFNQEFLQKEIDALKEKVEVLERSRENQAYNFRKEFEEQRKSYELKMEQMRESYESKLEQMREEFKDLLIKNAEDIAKIKSSAKNLIQSRGNADDGR